MPSPAPSTPLPNPPPKRTYSLRFILVVPYLLTLGFAAGAVGLLSLHQGQQAVEQVATQLRYELVQHISDHLHNVLAEPTQINQINLAVTDIGLVQFQDLDRLGRLFHRQLQIFPHVGYINYASEQRDFIGAERKNDGAIVLLQSHPNDPNRFWNYQLDAAGRKLKLYETYDPLSIREEGWYADAIKAGKPVWSSIYQWQNRPDVLSISASIPIYSQTRQLQGVLGVDLILSQIGEFLHSLNITPKAKAMVLERNGLLIANSLKESPYLKTNGQITRKQAIASQDPILRQAAAVVQQRFGSFQAIQSLEQVTVPLAGENHYIQLLPWRDGAGLDWLVMIIIPESDLMGEIHINRLQTLILSSVAMAVAIVLGLYTSRKIVEMVQRLGVASQAIADGHLNQTIPPSTIREMSVLAAIFNRMAEQLRNAFDQLEARVQERTRSLQQAEAKYRSIFENASDGIYQTTAAGQYLSANPALARIYGYESPGALMAHVQNIAQQLYVDSEARQRFVQEIEQRGEVTDFEAQVRRQDGSILWILENARAVRDPDGTLLYYEGTVTDITRRKLAEDALRDSTQKLRQQNQTLIHLTKNRALSEGRLEEALRDLAATAADWFAVDRVGVWLSEANLKTLDCILLWAEGHPIAEPGIVLTQAQYPAFFERLQTEPWLAVADLHQEPRLQAITADYFAKHDTRGLLCATISVSDHFLGMLCLEQAHYPREWSLEEEGFAKSLADLVVLALEARDRKQAELALSHAKELAESANRAKSQFLSNMSHELRTPLNAVIGFTQILRRDALLTADQQEYISIINRSGEHLLGLINDVLAMSKIESGRLSLDLNDFDLSHLLATVEGMFRLKAREKGLQFAIDCANTVPRYVRADESKLRQVLINLLGNAVKFTQVGHITVRLTVSPQPLQDPTLLPLTVEVEDTGAGIAPEELTLLFEPFVQTETGRKSQQGTGLGLSISRRFVELMGGQLQVQSTLGKGTLFSFQVSVEPIQTLPALDAQDTPPILGLAPDQPTYRILVVDDQDENRWVLVKLLTPLGFEVQEARNGQEAIDMSDRWQPHLIFMDMRMPILDGYEATRNIKSRRTNQHPVIIALTASAFEEERNLILHTGCDDFVSKPFRENHLLAKIAEHLGVVYLYDATDIETVDLPETPLTDPTQAVEQVLSQQSPDWQQAFHQAARRGDDDALLALIADLPATETTAIALLTSWVNDFQFETIMKLTQQEQT